MSEKSTVGTVICGVLLVIAANVYFWIQFASDLRFYSEQRPALCVDGRLIGQNILVAKLGVDDSKRYKGTVTMQCSFPVAVYPCYDDDIDAGAWNGRCHNLANVPAYRAGDWPRRMEEPDITCCEQNCLASDKCSDQQWSCSSGACDAYEKSMRLCAAKMRQEPYPCFTIEGKPEAGVREESSNFPAGWLVGGLVSTFCFLGCCVFAGVSLSNEENCVQKTMYFACFSGICFGVAFAIGTIVNAVRGEKDDKGLVESDYKDLAVATGSTHFGNNETAVAVEAPPPEGMHWAVVVAIVLGSIYGTICLFASCLFAVNYCKELGWRARAKACSEATAKADHQVTGYDPDAIRKEISSISVFSGSSNREIAKTMSRQDGNNLVKNTPGMTYPDIIGNAVLNQAENTRNLVRSISGEKFGAKRLPEPSVGV